MIHNKNGKPFFLWRHLNKLRWTVLTVVFAMLVLLPFLHVYQTYVSAHAYDLLAPSEKQLYDVMEALTQPFVSDPAEQLDAVKGNTWSGTFWELQLSDPLAAVGQMAAGLTLYGPFLLTVLIPVAFTVVLGRFFCGWICPATFLYELNSTFAAWLRWAGIKTGNHQLDKRLKYGVLAAGVVLSALTGSVMVAAVYPPAIIGREIYYAVALGGFGAGAVFFLITMLFDLLVARRGFCRYLCPGGALYSLLGRYRLVRIRRIVESCNDCAKCNVVCEFGLDPLRDGFGQECNNCTACIAICPTDALTFTIRATDVPAQGPGHLGKHYDREDGPVKNRTKDKRKVMAKALLIAFLAVTLWTASSGISVAHHVLGRPSYNLGEDSNTPSSQQAEVQIGDYMVTYMVFPAFPQPNAPGRISLYVKRLDNGETFDGKVAFKIRNDVMAPWLQNAQEESIGVQGLDDNKVFRQSFQFSQAGDYIISARFEVGDEPHVIDFPLRVGDVSPVSPLVIAGGLALVLLVVVGFTQRRRAMTGKVRGAREEPTET